MKSVKSPLQGINLSIRSKIVIAILVVIIMMGTLNIILMLSFLKYSSQYNVIVTNIAKANSVNGTFKSSIDMEMWNIVAGKTRFEEGRQYDIISNFRHDILQIMQKVSSLENKTRLDVTLRTVKTLMGYVDLIGKQIREKKKVAENEKVLENIRGVSQLVEDDIQGFILYEVKGCEVVNDELQSSINRWIFTNIAVLGILLVFSALAAWFISGSISKPIRELRRMTASVAEGNFNVRVENQNADEIASLGRSFNIMTEKVKELLENSKREQENLKKSELKVLQAQINPHFLYNTLDTIVWMSEAKNSEKVIEIVRALSNFFRITLSKGREWIKVREEIEHIRSYLIIQKIRYRDILDFKIEISEDILENDILKLTLQPLVENALYHGIKNKRSGGSIFILGQKLDEKTMVFDVVDNGLGMTAEKLAEIMGELKNESSELLIKESGFGLNNVHKRVMLYYGRQYGLEVRSEYNQGTHVRLTIPT